MRTLDALKKLFVAQGGDEDDVKNLHTDAEVIDKIADSGGGGGDMFFVTFSWDDDADGGNGGYVCDKTHAEIKDAYDSGKVLLSKEDGGEWGSQYGFGTVTPANFQAYYMYADTGSICVRKYNVSSSDIVTVTDFVATATEA